MDFAPTVHFHRRASILPTITPQFEVFLPLRNVPDFDSFQIRPTNCTFRLFSPYFNAKTAQNTGIFAYSSDRISRFFAYYKQPAAPSAGQSLREVAFEEGGALWALFAVAEDVVLEETEGAKTCILTLRLAQLHFSPAIQALFHSFRANFPFRLPFPPSLQYPRNFSVLPTIRLRALRTTRSLQGRKQTFIANNAKMTETSAFEGVF